ncbi:MAG: NUMOD3 domain-containing DNA-binding protein [[Clostridium] aminophilum]|uniref:NUMOD3 domain-containing DNA-binding protein n=1 Tax=[Clostridium] aminophilum TaxID=1526 RepID=UPI0026F1850C|nr:NUMOD3 domain-containing DNA-binding protein [[Clostridium] aminophilum]MDD6196863.1 NUMOD3 domain-containing DNA-binding protein [[Clostridium] aminophilum]
MGQTTQGFKKRYPCSGIGIERVYKSHLKNKLAGRFFNEQLLGEIEKYGFDAFYVEEEYDVALSREELEALEIRYIAEFKANICGYNSESGGANGRPNAKTREKQAKFGVENPFFGKHHTKETRDKLSKAKKGKYTGPDNPNYGKKWSREQRERLSKMAKGRPSPNKGRKMSESVRQRNIESHKDIWKRMPHPRLGKHWDEKFKCHQSEIMKGRYAGTLNPNRKRIICTTTGEVFETINDGAAKYGISPSGISLVLHGKRKSAGKYNGTPLEWSFV